MASEIAQMRSQMIHIITEHLATFKIYKKYIITYIYNKLQLNVGKYTKKGILRGLPTLPILRMLNG